MLFNKHKRAVRKLHKRFAASFEREIPSDLIAGQTLFAIDHPGANSLLVGSEEAKEKQFLKGSEIVTFLNEAPEGYLLAGFWGYGLNSHCFHYARADSWSRVWFRLPFGGTHMDNEDLAAAIPDFIEAFDEFEASVGGLVSDIEAVQNMMTGHYRLETHSGAVFETDRSLLYYPVFSNVFADVFADEM
ncbi:MAG: hypothetical protein RIB59_08810 [Rhodospirillales bacterium]